MIKLDKYNPLTKDVLWVARTIGKIDFGEYGKIDFDEYSKYAIDHIYSHDGELATTDKVRLHVLKMDDSSKECIPDGFYEIIKKNGSEIILEKVDNPDLKFPEYSNLFKDEVETIPILICDNESGIHAALATVYRNSETLTFNYHFLVDALDTECSNVHFLMDKRDTLDDMVGGKPLILRGGNKKAAIMPIRV